MQQNNDVGNNSNNQENLLRFLPNADEQSLELQRLFNLIDDQIDLFIGSESNSIPRAQLNRLVAGHLCKDDIEELPAVFKAFRIGQPSKVINKELNPWNKHVSVKGGESNDLGGTGLFKGSPRLSLEWSSMTTEEKDVYRSMNIAPKAREKKRKMKNADQTDDRTIKSCQYQESLNSFESWMAAMLDNFGTHMILLAATDSRSTYLFPPYVAPNSGK